MQTLFETHMPQFGFDWETNVFIDVVALDNYNLNKAYAWVLQRTLLRNKSIFIRGVRYTIICAMSATGILAFRAFEGAATQEIFTDFFVNDVMSQMNAFPSQNSVVFLDECAVHDKVALGQCASDNHIGLVYLPPYSPQYNPIESLFNQIKTWLKSNRIAVARAAPGGIRILEGQVPVVAAAAAAAAAV
eukprot:gene16523-22750_t